MSTNETHIPAKFLASANPNRFGRLFDLRTLTSKALTAYKWEVRGAGDEACAARCDAILRDRGWA